MSQVPSLIFKLCHKFPSELRYLYIFHLAVFLHRLQPRPSMSEALLQGQVLFLCYSELGIKLVDLLFGLEGDGVQFMLDLLSILSSHGQLSFDVA